MAISFASFLVFDFEIHCKNKRGKALSYGPPPPVIQQPSKAFPLAVTTTVYAAVGVLTWVFAAASGCFSPVNIGPTDTLICFGLASARFFNSTFNTPAS